MEWSDDKVIETIMDTHVKVGKIEGKLSSHCSEFDEKYKGHDKRIERIEKEQNMNPLDKNVKYYAKKFAPVTLGLSMLGYVIYDIYMRVTKGG